MNNKIKMVFGTHAIFQKKIEFFKNLGYIIIDEQHKFGVRQRKQYFLIKEVIIVMFC